MAQTGVSDAWRIVYKEPEDVVGVGVTREQRRIDGILLSQPLGDLVKAVFMMLAGGSDHMAGIAKVCPSLVHFAPVLVLFPTPSSTTPPRLAPGPR